MERRMENFVVHLLGLFELTTKIPFKGQLISKFLFGFFNSPKKQMKKFDFTTMVPQIELFLFVFWEKWRHQKDILKLTDL